MCPITIHERNAPLNRSKTTNILKLIYIYLTASLVYHLKIYYKFILLVFSRLPLVKFITFYPLICSIIDSVNSFNHLFSVMGAV